MFGVLCQQCILGRIRLIRRAQDILPKLFDNLLHLFGVLCYNILDIIGQHRQMHARHRNSSALDRLGHHIQPACCKILYMRTQLLHILRSFHI